MTHRTRAELLGAIVKACAWLDEIVAGDGNTVETITNQESRSVRSVRMSLSLACLAPSIAEATVDGLRFREIRALAPSRFAIVLVRSGMPSVIALKSKLLMLDGPEPDTVIVRSGYFTKNRVSCPDDERPHQKSPLRSYPIDSNCRKFLTMAAAAARRPGNSPAKAPS
ncbi:hypothetical protein [Hyphomonas sp.]|uniref:hypothetical protein n=2 Tax=Pseudomonadota TaxID=1224 RepID=UPI00326373A2